MLGCISLLGCISVNANYQSCSAMKCSEVQRLYVAFFFINVRWGKLEQSLSATKSLSMSGALGWDKNGHPLEKPLDTLVFFQHFACRFQNKGKRKISNCPIEYNFQTQRGTLTRGIGGKGWIKPQDHWTVGHSTVRSLDIKTDFAYSPNQNCPTEDNLSDRFFTHSTQFLDPRPKHPVGPI